MPNTYVPNALRHSRYSQEVTYLGLAPEFNIYKKLRNAGSEDMNVNGSVTAVDFKYTCPVGKVVLVSRLHFHILDSNVDPNDFGGIAGGIATGLILGAFDSDDSQILDFLDGDTIKKNTHFDHIAGTDANVKTGTGLDALAVRFSVHKSGASMRLTAGQYIQMTVQDDLTTLNEFTTLIQGLIFDAE